MKTYRDNKKILVSIFILSMLLSGISTNLIKIQTISIPQVPLHRASYHDIDTMTLTNDLCFLSTLHKDTNRYITNQKKGLEPNRVSFSYNFLLAFILFGTFLALLQRATYHWEYFHSWLISFILTYIHNQDGEKG